MDTSLYKKSFAFTQRARFHPQEFMMDREGSVVNNNGNNASLLPYVPTAVVPQSSSIYHYVPKYDWTFSLHINVQAVITFKNMVVYDIDTVTQNKKSNQIRSSDITRISHRTSYKNTFKLFIQYHEKRGRQGMGRQNAQNMWVSHYTASNPVRVHRKDRRRGFAPKRWETCAVKGPGPSVSQQSFYQVPGTYYQVAGYSSLVSVKDKQKQNCRLVKGVEEPSPIYLVWSVTYSLRYVRWSGGGTKATRRKKKNYSRTLASYDTIPRATVKHPPRW